MRTAQKPNGASFFRIRPLSRRHSVKALLGYINALIAERAQIPFDKPLTLAQEKAWLRDSLAALGRKEALYLVAEHDGKIAGIAHALKGRGRERGNVELGLSIANAYRRHHYGTLLFNEIIRQARAKLRPERIYLRVFAGNGPALRLYRKRGFRRFAVLRKWVNWQGTKQDYVYMALDRGKW